MPPVVIKRIEAMAYRAPIDTPVSTSFGTMKDRPAVFLRIEDADGCFGWGEIFANWPVAGAEHRVRLLIEDIAELFLNRPIAAPADLFDELTRRTHIRALQSGEWGPFRQVIAGIDIAMHDLSARRAGLSIRKLLNPDACDAVPFYASGIHIRDADASITKARQEGARNFKVKVGFDLSDDIAALRELDAGLKPGEQLFTDANQAWDLGDAMAFVSGIEATKIGWLEEPLPADAPDADWTRLAAATKIPLAGGENLNGHSAFANASALGIIQPDVVKWGGITGCFAVAKEALANGRRYCPHFLGGGIGLAASAQLLAAVGGDGLLELDANPNPLRDLITSGEVTQNGQWRVGNEVGLGVETLPDELSRFSTYRLEARS